MKQKIHASQFKFHEKGLTILEPVLLLCIGLIIGAIALSIVMPIYQMINVVR